MCWWIYYQPRYEILSTQYSRGWLFASLHAQALSTREAVGRVTLIWGGQAQNFRKTFRNYLISPHSNYLWSTSTCRLRRNEKENWKTGKGTLLEHKWALVTHIVTFRILQRPPFNPSVPPARCSWLAETFSYGCDHSKVPLFTTSRCFLFRNHLSTSYVINQSGWNKSCSTQNLLIYIIQYIKVNKTAQ